MSLTPTIGLTLPVIGGDENTWGNELNGNLSIIDLLGAAGIFGVASNFTVVAGTQTERFYRVTTGGLLVTGTLPDPGTIPPGKLFNVKVLDVGGSITLQFDAIDNLDLTTVSDGSGGRVCAAAMALSTCQFRGSCAESP